MERNETKEKPSTGMLSRTIQMVESVLLVLVTGWMLVGQLAMQTAPVVETVVLVAQMCLLLLSFRFLLQRCPVELRLLLQASLWLFAAQALTERLGWGVFYPLSMMLLTLAAAALGQRLRRDRRKLELHTVMIVWCAILAVLSACGLLTVFAGKQLPGTAIQVSTMAAGVNKLAVFGLSGEAVACALAAGIGVLLLQCFSSRGWLWKVLTVVCLPLYLLVVLLENCAPAILAVSVTVSLLLAEMLQRPMRIRMKKTAPRVLMTLLAAVVISAAAFVGLCIGADQLAGRLNPQPAAAQTDTGEDAQADSDADADAAQAAADADTNDAAQAGAADDTQADTAAAQPTATYTADNTDAADSNSGAATQATEAQSTPQTPSKPGDAPAEAVSQAEDQPGEDADKSAAQEAAAAAAASAVQEAAQTEASAAEPTDAPSEAAQPTEAENAPAPAVKGKAQTGVTTAAAMVETEERKNWSDVRGELEGYPQGLLFGLAESASPVPVHDQALYLLWQGGIPLVLIMAAVVLLLIWRLIWVYFKADQQVEVRVWGTVAVLAGLLVLVCTMPLMEDAFSFAWAVFALLLGWFIQASEEYGVTAPKHQQRVPRASYKPQRLLRPSYNPQRLHNSAAPAAPAAAPQEESALEMDAQESNDGSEWEEDPGNEEMKDAGYPQQDQEAYPEQEPETPDVPEDTGAAQ